MGNAPREIRAAFEALRECYGVYTAIIIASSDIVDRFGDASRARSLASVATSILDDDGVAYRWRGDRGIAVARKGSFYVALEGDPRALASYVPTLARILEGKELSCEWCGAKLDRETVPCSNCGARIPITVGYCPRCGARFSELTCPRCGNPITPLGARMSSSSSLASLVLGIVLSGVCGTVSTWFSAPLPVVAVSVVAPFMVGLISYLK